MDYKKKYEQALENLKRIKTANEDNKELVNFIEYEYPELKKSEDERIRKAIIKMVSDIAGGFPFEKYGIQKKEALAWLEKQDKKDSQVILPTFTFDDILALQCCMKKVQKDEELYNQLQILHDRLHDAYWLEKQGGQKPTEKVEPKFKVGDWITDYTSTFQIIKIEDEWYIADDGDKVCFDVIHQYYHLWTIQDAKAGDVLADDYGIYIFEKFDECDKNCFACNGAYQYSEKVFECEHMLCSTDVHPATKEQRDLLFQKMKEAGYEWNDEKKELKMAESVQPELPNGEDYGIDSLYHAERILEKTLGGVEGYQSDDGILEHKCAIEAVKRLYKQKPTWSEEDEKMLDSFLHKLEVCELLSNKEITWIKNKFKSLKERMKGE